MSKVNRRTDGKRMLSWLALAAVALASLALAGCTVLALGVGAGAGAATVAYVGGALEVDVSADPRAIEAAAGKAFKALDIRPISSASSTLDAEIVGRTAADTRIVVSAKAREGGGSRLKIRVGIFGDEPLSRRVYEEMRKHL